MKLLIVDDERSTREGLRDTVDWQEANITDVCCARNAFEALQIMRSTPADILLMDIRMPGMDGLELSTQLLQEYPDIRIILLSAYADFTYARTAMTLGINEYLVKPVDIGTLLTAVIKACNEIAMQRLSSAGGGTPRDSIDRWLLRQGDIPAAFSPVSEVRCVLLLLEGGESMPTPFLTAHLRSELEHVFLNALGVYGIVCAFVPDTVNQLGFIMQEPPEAQRKACFQTLSGALKACEALPAMQEMTLSCSIGNSRPLSQAHCALKEAQDAIAMRFFLGRHVIIRREQISAYSYESPRHPECIQQPLNKAILARDAQACLELIRPLFRQYQFASVQEIPIVKEYCQLLLLQLFRHLESKHINRLFCMQEGTQLDTLDMWCAHIETCYHAFLDLLSQRGPSQSRHLVGAVKDYVSAHYLEPISLTTAGDALGRNPNYLGHLFLREEGISFPEYVSLCRVEQAKKLLGNTSLASYEIAQRSGFTNYRYFTQVFKKLTNLSPTQWRIRLLQCKKNI